MINQSAILTDDDRKFRDHLADDLRGQLDGVLFHPQVSYVVETKDDRVLLSAIYPEACAFTDEPWDHIDWILADYQQPDRSYMANDDDRGRVISTIEWIVDEDAALEEHVRTSEAVDADISEILDMCLWHEPAGSRTPAKSEGVRHV